MKIMKMIVKNLLESIVEVTAAWVITIMALVTIGTISDKIHKRKEKRKAE